MFGKSKDNKEEKKTASSPQEQKREAPAAPPEQELNAVHFGEMSPDLKSIILSYIPTSQLQTAPPNAPVDLAWKERFKLHYPKAFLKIKEKSTIDPELDADLMKVEWDWKTEFENESKKVYKNAPDTIVKLFLAIKDHDEDAISQIFTEGNPSERFEFLGLLVKNNSGVAAGLFTDNKNHVKGDVPENQGILDLLYKNIYNIYSAESDEGLVNTSKVDSTGRTILYWAIACSQSPEAVQSLIAQGSRVDEVYPESFSPIHLVSFLGRTKLLSMLIGEAKEKESLVNRVDGRGMTPLMWAALGGAINSFSLLIGEGADLQRRCEVEGGNALDFALSAGQDQAAVKLLEMGVIYNTALPAHNNQPIHLASERGCLEAVKLILSNAGASSGLLEVKNSFGSTPLIHAAGEGHIEIVKYLLAQKKQELNKRPFESKDEKSVEQVKRQLFQNMLNSTNTKNITAISRAAEKGHDEIVRLLVNEGAAIPAKLPRENKLSPATQAFLEQKQIEQRTARFLEERTKDPRTFIPTGSYFGGLITTVRSHKSREIAAAEALSELQAVRREIKAAEATHQIIYQEYKSIEKQKSGGGPGLRHEHELADLKKEKAAELLLAKEALQEARLKLEDAENLVDACKVPIDKSTELDEIREAIKRSLK